MTSQNEAGLQAEISRARAQLDLHVQSLRAIDAELEGLAAERQRYRLLDEICGALGQLDELGAAHLFWGAQASAGATDEQLRSVRGRMSAFEKRLSEIEERRQVVIDEIDQASEKSELLEDDLLELQRLEEERKLEWVIERPVETFPVPASIMPWARSGEDDRRFRKALTLALLLSLLLGLVVPQIRLPVPEPWEVVVVPDRLTRLIRQERPQPPPPPRVQEEAKPLESEPLKPEEPRVAKETPAKKTRRTTSKGILAFREKFSSLADSKPSARLGAQARIRNSGKTASARPQRSLVATQRPGSSGGIDIGSLSRDVGGSGEGIEGVEIARATSAIQGVAGPDRLMSDGPSPGRTDEEIQIVFDRHKAALYRLYNRELRRDPTLKGQVVLRIRIEPDGSVSLCNVQSSDMNAPNLSAQVVARVQNFDFGAKEDVSAITILYPIDFLPAT